MTIDTIGILDVTQRFVDVMIGPEFAIDLRATEARYRAKGFGNFAPGTLEQPTKPDVNVFTYESTGNINFPNMFVMFTDSEKNTYGRANTMVEVLTFELSFGVRDIEPKRHFELRAGYADAAQRTIMRALKDQGQIFNALVTSVNRSDLISESQEDRDDLTSFITLIVEIQTYTTTEITV